MAVYKAKPERVQRTMTGALVAVLLLTAGQAMAQLRPDGNQLWHQNSDGIVEGAEESDFFGQALATGDFNSDGFADLAIGVPLEDIGGTLGGAVNVIYGGPDGLAVTGNQIWHQDSDGIAGRAEEADFLGCALATGDFNKDGFADLAIGVDDEDIGEIQDAGAVNVIYGGPSGLTASGNQIWHQDSDGIAGAAERGDQLGGALATGDFNKDGFADLAIGVDDKDIGEIQDAGAVNVIYGGPAGLTAINDQLWHQDSDGIAGAAERGDQLGGALASGDFNKDGFADLAIGVAGEDIGERQVAGAVNVIYGGPGGLAATSVAAALPDQLWSQDSDGIEGLAEAGDNFGFALAVGHFNSDGYEDLAIGAHREDVGGIRDAGRVNVIYGGPDGLEAAGDQIWHQDSDGIAEQSEEEDLFGHALAAGDFNDDGLEDLALGVPLEDVGGIEDAGAVNVLYGAGPRFSREGIVSAASFLPGAAPTAIMSLFGVNLAGATEVASEVPLPTSLAGTTVRVAAQPVLKQVPPQGILGSTLARLFFVSSGQLNFLVPPVPLGPATITVTREDGIVDGSFSATIDIARVAPALFSADATGSGVAAALFLREAGDGTRTEDLIYDPDTLAAVPIALGSAEDRVFLLLFGTGIRGFTSDVTARVGGFAVPVLGAVPQGEFEGVDQVNIGPLPRNLGRAIGLVTEAGLVLAIVLTVDGQETNPVVFLLGSNPPPGVPPGPRPPAPPPGPVGLEPEPAR